MCPGEKLRKFVESCKNKSISPTTKESVVHSQNKGNQTSDMMVCGSNMKRRRYQETPCDDKNIFRQQHKFCYEAIKFTHNWFLKYCNKSTFHDFILYTNQIIFICVCRVHSIVKMNGCRHAYRLCIETISIEIIISNGMNKLQYAVAPDPRELTSTHTMMNDAPLSV